MNDVRNNSGQPESVLTPPELVVINSAANIIKKSLSNDRNFKPGTAFETKKQLAKTVAKLLSSGAAATFAVVPQPTQVATPLFVGAFKNSR